MTIHWPTLLLSIAIAAFTIGIVDIHVYNVDLWSWAIVFAIFWASDIIACGITGREPFA